MLDVVDVENRKVGEVNLDDAVFGAPVKPHLVHEVVVMQLTNCRQGTASTKGRSEVSGGGRKPWRQKGTGRARQGSIRAPQWRHGGIVFGPKPRDYSSLVPKQVRRAALCSALSAKVQEGNVIVLDRLTLEQASTKVFKRILGALGADGRKTLVVIPGKEEVVFLSARNLSNVKVLPAKGLNVYDVLLHEKLIVAREALPLIQEALAL
ncbi:MAG: 50S ribosomal protein L4 [candidate division NC10 bacterium]|nr:50S ribosomal protein L4 [candidate division NC10 bacterium]